MGKVTESDKCVVVESSFRADVVPAVPFGAADADPLLIYSRREARERLNYPHRHYEASIEKHAETGDKYKPTVRLFKRWAREHFAGTSVAPSYYVECAIHSVPSEHFKSYLPYSFEMVGRHLLTYTRSSFIWSVAGDRDILVANEWSPDHFERFYAQLETSVDLCCAATSSSDRSEADRLWRAVFGD